jgi:hypothetical protein
MESVFHDKSPIDWTESIQTEMKRFLRDKQSLREGPRYPILQLDHSQLKIVEANSRIIYRNNSCKISAEILAEKGKGNDYADYFNNACINLPMWLWQEEELQWRNALLAVFFELQLTPAIIAGSFAKKIILVRNRHDGCCCWARLIGSTKNYKIPLSLDRHVFHHQPFA